MRKILDLYMQVHVQMIEYIKQKERIELTVQSLLITIYCLMCLLQFAEELISTNFKIEILNEI